MNWRWFIFNCTMLGGNLGCAIGFYLQLALIGPTYWQVLILPVNLGNAIWYGRVVREQWREYRSQQRKAEFAALVDRSIATHRQRLDAYFDTLSARHNDN